MEQDKTGAAAVIGPERLKALADGVFAIVMTLLVLELAVPDAAAAGSDKLLTRLAHMWPEFFFYVMSFLILGVFWHMHHMIFSAIVVFDDTVTWLNIFYLLFVAVIPFSTSLYGEFLHEPLTSVFYGANQLLVVLMGFTTWSYATWKHRLVPDDLDPAIIKGAKLMGYLYFIVLGAAIGLSFVHMLIPTLIYAVYIASFVLISIIGRADALTVLQVKPKTGSDQ